MRKSHWILGCLVFFLSSRPLLARDKTDLLVLNNGDRVTCEIKGLEAGVLYVSLDWADGTVSVDWSKVAHLESTQLFVVKTSAGVVYTGSLKTPDTAADRPVTIAVASAAPQPPAVLERAQVVNLIATSDRFWERFNGQVSAGSIYAKANQSTQYSLGAETAYVRERWVAALNYESSLSATEGTKTSARNSVTLAYQHLLRPHNWFYAGLGNFLQSSEQQISVQTTLAVGVGRYLKRSDHASISLLGGTAWQRTNYNVFPTPDANQNVGAAILYGQAQLFRFSKTQLDFTGELVPALSEPGRLRAGTNISYYIKIVSDLKWNISFYGDWDNRPPPNVPGSDYGSSSGLTWTYGLK